ncbi:hypothetical protein ACHAWF_003707 [Thalassiosira exigua]
MADLRSKGWSHKPDPRSNGSARANSFQKFGSLFDQFRIHSVADLIERGDNAALDDSIEEALRHYNKALDKERQTSSDASTIQEAVILHKIGLALIRTGDSFAAMNSFEQALQIRQEKIGPGSEDAAETTAQMLKILDEIRLSSGVGARKFVKGDDGNTESIDVGTNLLEWGQYKEAETVLKQCLQNMNHNDDSRDDEKITVLAAMAQLDRAQGKYDEAKELYLEVLKTAKKSTNSGSGDMVDLSIIPNLIVQGDILYAVGQLEKSLETYQRAETIHRANFNPGQKDFQLEECKQKMDNVTIALKNEMALVPSEFLGRENKVCGGTPVIVITDIGRDIDDALALIALSSLKTMFMLNPVAVITTSFTDGGRDGPSMPPDEKRACLCRLILDSLSMEDVPVGLGTDVPCPGEKITLHCFESLANQNPFRFEKGSQLMTRILTNSEPRSVKILCISNLKDISELMVKQLDLFRSKVKEVVVMGGAGYLKSREQIIPDDSAFNNSCDIQAARHVYAECQQNAIPTLTVSRYAAYECPLNVSFLDGLQNTSHLLAGEVRNANFKAMQQLWKKVNMPAWMPGRGKLPARCNRKWFLDFFNVDIDDETYTSQYVWENSSLYLYDSFAMISCADAYVDLYFIPRCYEVGKTVHRVIGFVTDEGVQVSGVRRGEHLVREIECLLRQALMLSLDGMDLPKSENKASLDVDSETDTDETKDTSA